MRDEKTTRVHEIRLSQPVSVALQLCLVDLLKFWDITPTAVTSHSSGEIAAAYAVGALTFKEALGVVYYRGELAQKHHERLALDGGMLAAGLSAEKAQEYVRDTSGAVVVACHNSPDSVTLSGDMPALNEVATKLQEDGFFARKLNVPLAYHSHHMMHMARDYTDSLKANIRTPSTWCGALFASPVTGEIITSPKVLTAEHFVRNLTSPVLFAEAFEQMCFSEMTSDGTPRAVGQDANIDLIVEIGAHSTLYGPIRQILKARKIPYVSCLKRFTNAVHTMQDAACDLISRGYPVSLREVNSHGNGKFVPGLPSYTWNHTSTYWTESRLYKEYRHKRFPPHELLGTPISGGNKITPTWRNFLRTSDIPWLVEHKLGSDTVLPGAGYVAMAIEAVRLLTDPSEKTILKYKLRDIDIANALTIPDTTTGVEIELSLRPCTDKELDYKGWYEFELCSVSASDDSWVQHCKGFVTTETVSSSKPAATTYEMEAPSSKDFFPPDSKVVNVDPESIFVGLRQMSLFHGPVFQNLITSQVAGNKSITNLAISPAASECDETYVLHPTTLDSFIQAAYVSIPQATQSNAMVVPRSIRNLVVPRDINRNAGENLSIFVNLLKADKRGAKLSAVATNEAAQKSTSFLQIEDLYCQAVAQESDDSAGSKVAAMCSETRWELDVLPNIPVNIKESLNIELEDSAANFEKILDRVSFNFIYDAVKKLEGATDSETWESHSKLFYDWMKTIAELWELSPGSKNWSKAKKGLKQKLADDLEADNAAGKLIVRIGRSLPAIVRGDVKPLDLMKEDNLLDLYYEELPRLKNRSYEQLKKIVELYAIKNPGANVLEIGGRTGAVSKVVLEGFAVKTEGSSGTLIGHYDFTDVSSEPFEKARSNLAGWTGLVEFRELNISSDPLEQSFAGGKYDLIIASATLCNTPDLKKTLEHVRKIVKPGGTLIMVEATSDRLDSQLLFGTLPGWWLSEESTRKSSPSASAEMWNDVLKATGFTGIDFQVGDCEETQYQSTSILLTTAVETETPSYPSSVSIVCSDKSAPSEAWLKELKETIEAQIGTSVVVEQFSRLEANPDTTYLFLPDMTEPFLHNMNKEDFEKLRKMLLNGQGTLWLSCGGLIDAKEPLYAQAQGLLRTVKQEDANKRYVLLDFEPTTSGPWSSDKIPHIGSVLVQSFNSKLEDRNIEWEYAVKDSMLHVPRVYPNPTEDKLTNETTVIPDPEMQPFWQEGRPLVWETSKAGELSNLYFTDNLELAETDVPSGVVEIQTQAMGLNFRDVMVALGQIDESLVGHDCAGIVKRLGPNTESSGLRVGDRVCGVMRGRFASVTRALATSVIKIPDNMSWEDAASLPFIFLTSYIAFVDIARLEKGERVLIHAGTGGVGQSAIMLAQHIGAEVFVTCSTETKRDMLIEQYNLDSDHILSSRDTSFAAAIMARTRGAGVDVVINSLSGPLLKATWECMARFGRFVEIGKMDLEAARRLDLTPFSRSALMAGFDLLQYSEYNGRFVQKGLQELMRLWHEKAIRPVYPLTTYPISDMETALRRMQRGTHVGKQVLVPGKEDQVKVVSRSVRKLSLDDPNGTYMIAGGVGGIGKVIAEWMIEKGAKNILIVSRSAESHPNSAPLVEKAQKDGCKVYIRNCDISDEQSLVKLLQECPTAMPPIRGVIQAAMALNDTILDLLTFDQWERSIMPKVAGSINLHKHLEGLQFFVMLSSVAGVVGHSSQANYAAGNTFQDALARHRTAHGLPAVAIDLGAVGSVGAVAEAGDAMRDRIEKNLGSSVIPIARVIRLIESAVIDPLRKSLDHSQIITGIVDYGSISNDAAVKKDKRFSTLRLGSSGNANSSKATTARSPDEEFKQAVAVTQRGSSESVELVTGALTNKLASLFNVAAAEIDINLGLSHLGVDSLVAVELRNWLSGVVQAKVTIFEILQSATVKEFSRLVAGRTALIA
jgi:NADPH:quinone reductase-like Zn-dependent oxidoreductase/malonyl CoA-acyl carrier protein transacylase/NAD(P)-dependent dehydrogenase (short-subunit alcohol dehydrogenase family)/SAM-dependent methyltransferase